MCFCFFFNFLSPSNEWRKKIVLMEFVYWLRDWVRLCSSFTRRMISQWVLSFGLLQCIFYFMEKNWMCMLSSQSIMNSNAFFPPIFPSSFHHFCFVFCLLTNSNNIEFHLKVPQICNFYAQIIGTLTIKRGKKKFLLLDKFR